VDDVEQVRAVGEKFVATIGKGPTSALMAPDAIIWHNFDDVEMTVDEVAARQAERAAANVQPLLMDEVQMHVMPGRCLLQYVFRFGRDREIRVPACMILTVDGGLITRLEEYIDGGALTEARRQEALATEATA
jgi:ketosteroid isomerase-like protein